MTMTTPFTVHTASLDHVQYITSTHGGLQLLINFGGDRLVAAERALIAVTSDGQTIAMVTYGMTGELNIGPSIIGYWAESTRQDAGMAVFMAAVDNLYEIGASVVNFDICFQDDVSLVRSLEKPYRDMIKVRNATSVEDPVNGG